MRKIYETKAFLIMRSFDTLSVYEGMSISAFWEFLTERGRILDNFKRGKARHQKKIKERDLEKIFPPEITAIIFSFSYPVSLLQVKKAEMPSVPNHSFKVYNVLERGKVTPVASVDSMIYVFHPIYTIQRKTFVNIWVRRKGI